MQSGAELWQLDAELLGLSFDGPNGELNVLGEDLCGRSGILPALHCFRARMGGTLRLDHAAKLVDKIPHDLYSELGWQVETLLQKYYPRDPAYEEALGGNSPQRRDPPNSDEHTAAALPHGSPVQATNGVSTA